MFDWSDLRLFLAVQRTGSLAAAARLVRLNATTVGRRIEALEAALGTPLFERLPGGWRPSEAGVALIPAAEAMEAQAFSVERSAGARAGGVAGLVRITCTESLGARFLTPLLAPLFDRHPALEIELLTANRILDLARREADLGVRLGRPAKGSLVARRLGKVAYAVYGTGRWLGFDESLAHVPEAAWMEPHLAGAPPVLRSNSTAVLLAAAEAGIGRAVLPCWLADRSASLRRVGDPVVERELWLAVHPDLRRADRIRAVADHLVEAVAANAAVLAGRPA